MAWIGRFLNALRPARLDREFEEELEFHRQIRLRQAREQGLAPEEAERETRRRMGNLAAAKDEMRDARVAGWLASFLQDLGYGLTLLRRDRGVSALIVLALALGVGGNVAVFTLLKAAFLDPLPYPGAGRLVTITESHSRLRESGRNLSVALFEEIRARSRAIEQMAFLDHRDYQMTGGAEPVRVVAARVTASFFPLLGVSAAQGRVLVEDENQAGRTSVAVLTEAFWRSRLGADPNIIGRTLRLDGEPVTVVGVLPVGFHFDYPALRIPEPVDLYRPYPLQRPNDLSSGLSSVSEAVRVLARLRPGSATQEAGTELRDLAATLAAERPSAFRHRDGGPSGFSLEAAPLQEAIAGVHRPMLGLLAGSAAIILLISCANAAQLLLARSLRRRREVAIRAALGASRLRLIRQFFLEALVLAVCGGLAGLMLSGWITRLLTAVLPVRSPILESARMDAGAIAAALALSLLAAVLSGALPAVRGSRWTPGLALRAQVATGEGNRWRHSLIAAEAALSVFLLCAAGLIAHNLWTLISTPMGFDAENVLTMRLKLPGFRPGALDARARLALEQYRERIAALPYVDAAATVTGPPLRPARGGPTELIGVTDAAGALVSVIADNHLISPDYFRVLRIPLLAGRSFRAADGEGQPRVAIVNEEFARRFGLGRDVVGRQIFEPGEPITIVGLVGDVRTRGRQIAPVPEVYLSSLQFSWANVYLMVRSPLPPAQLLAQVKAAIRAANPDQAVYGVMTLEEMIADALREPRFQSWVIGAFALLAVAMAIAGMYSVVSCLVSQRTTEIAIRMALGARRGAIVRAILGVTSLWMVTGLAAGLGLGLAARHSLRSLSGAVSGGSPWMFAVVALLFLVAALAAAWLPARQAARLDPAVALRAE
jgi:predicted permease